MNESMRMSMVIFFKRKLCCSTVSVKLLNLNLCFIL